MSTIPVIDWKRTEPDAVYSSYTGTDAAGNVYYTPANGETVLVTAPDGRRGYGWTAGEALDELEHSPRPASYPIEPETAARGREAMAELLQAVVDMPPELVEPARRAVAAILEYSKAAREYRERQSAKA